MGKPTETIAEINTDINKVLSDSANTINTEVEAKLAKKRGPKGPRTQKQTAQPQPAAGTMVKLSKDQWTQTLAGAFAISGFYLTKATGFEGWTLSQEELQAVSMQGAEVADAFVPQINSKWVALGGFTLAVASVYGMKFMQYNEWATKVKTENKGFAPQPKTNNLEVREVM